MSAPPAVLGLDRMAQARQDAVELAALVHDVGADAIAEHLAGLEPARKDALLVALACAVDLNLTTRQWWGWLDDPVPVPVREVRGVRPVPTAAEVRRFARANGLSDDQVWRAVVDLYAAPTATATATATATLAPGTSGTPGRVANDDDATARAT